MNSRALRVLEYKTIIEIIKGYAVSETGREMISQMTPESDYDLVTNLLKESEDAVIFLRRRGFPSIDGFVDITNHLKRAEIGGTLNALELIRICDNMKIARRLKEHLAKDNIQTDDNYVEILINNLYQNKRTEEKINNAIISEDEISDHASPELYSIRKQILSMQANIKDKLNEIIRSTRYQKYIQEAVVTLRGDRYVVPVKQEFRNEFPGLIHDASSSGATIFIEPMAVVELNNKIKDTKIRETAEIDRILKELTKEVILIADGLFANITILTKLDYLFAKARFALNNNCICPKLNSDKKIRIIQGKHPLLNKDKVVPVDFWIGENFNTLIITGPNTGGKTVSLKTVGLFVLMVQSGILIPAKEGTSMCLFKNVYADIGDEQSIEQSLSTFSSHMKNIVYILEHSTSDDLVLFDELGAGTDPSEGAALAISILENLCQQNVITVATTHYSELKAFALTHDGVENACCEFDIETLMPTYKLLIGIPGKSNAFSISRKLGLLDSVLQRAQKLISAEERNFEDVMINLENSLKEARREREETKEALNQANLYKKTILSEQEKTQDKKDMILQKANTKARELLAVAVSDIDNMIKELKTNKLNQTAEQQINSAREAKQNIMKKLVAVNKDLNTSDDDIDNYELSGDFAKNLKMGDSVIIKNMNTVASVLSKPDKNGDVRILAGIMKMNMNISNLKPNNEKQQKNSFNAVKTRNISAKAKNIKSEIDFRGSTVDEAILELDKYLDDAQISNLNEVCIIHGKGTGALRAGIHQFLKSNPHVDGFRLGLYGEGENGVTIVQLK